jgi:hypothetical protein
MHEEVITTTSSSNFSNVNSTSSLHQTDGTITVSIVHPHQQHHQHTADIGEYIASSDCSTLTTSQIIPSQSSSDHLSSLKDDVSSVIMNGSITNSNDPNVLILPATETCDSDKNTLTLSNMQADQVELELHDSVNDETSSREEGRFLQQILVVMLLMLRGRPLQKR